MTRKTMTVALPLLVALLGSACGDKSSPTAPAPAPAPTRVIRLGGNLNFGDVTVGQVRNDGILTISNDGNSTLTISGITSPCGSSGYSSSFTSGTIAAGSTQTATIRFAPLSAGNCTGTLTVNGDQTSGVNTITITGNGVAAAPPPAAVRTMTGTWRGTWSVYSFTMVLTQTGTVVTGTYSDQDGAGQTDPGQPGSFIDPNVTLRIKQAAFADFTFTGTMDATGRVVSGTARAAGGSSALTMTKQ